MANENSTLRQGQRVDPYRGFKFRALIDGFESAGFKTISGLNVETEVVDYREGIDYGHNHKLPGLTSFDPIEMERGKSERKDFEKWQGLTYDAKNGKGEPDPAFRKNIVIELRNYNDEVVKKWEIKHAWVSRLEHGTLDAGSSDVFIEKIVIQHEGMYPV